jgi:putative solute:sodium symporter small subunit
MNNIVILGFPLGFYMAAQGSLIVFVVLIFWFAARQNAIDEEFGVAED